MVFTVISTLNRKKKTHNRKPNLSNEGMSDGCALPLGAEKILHLSCRNENSKVVTYTYLTEI